MIPTESPRPTMPPWQRAAMRHVRFTELPLRARLAVVWEIFRLQARIIFSHRLLWFLAAMLI